MGQTGGGSFIPHTGDSKQSSLGRISSPLRGGRASCLVDKNNPDNIIDAATRKQKIRATGQVSMFDMFAGVDIKVKAAIYNLLEDMRAEGKAIMIISEEIMELIGMCDRIYIMKDGKINGELERSPELSDKDLISKMV